MFRRGRAAQTLLVLANVVLMALDDTGTNYQVLVRSSFAGHLTSWLLDAATEYRDTPNHAQPVQEHACPPPPSS